jgi:hypothetical protein
MQTNNVGPFSGLDSLQYSPLGKNEFRLLEITRLKETLGKSWPVCRLFHVLINNAPKYNALSYVWGPQNDRETIAINTSGFSVSVELCHTLCALFRCTEPRVVWIDAICINQNDDAEKATQIPLMSEIYNRAACVVGWVGRDKDGSDDLMINMDYISDLLSKVKGLVTENTLKDHGLPPKEWRVWMTVDPFLSRPWFRRLWVYQEIILSRELTILCESRTVAWASLIRLLNESRRTVLDSFLEDLRKDNLKDACFEMGTPRNFMLKVDHIRNFYIRNREVGTTYMGNFIRDSSTLHCNYNVDRIYGLLGLVSENVRRYIKIDYTLEERFWEVWVSAGKLLSVFEREEFWHLLAVSDSCDPDTKCPELPSWFPDLRNGITNARHPFLWDGAFAGGSGTSADLWTCQDSDKLWVVGLSIDVVEDPFPSKWCWPDALEKASEIPAGLAWHYKCLELARISEKRSQDYLEDYLFTITAGIFDSSPGASLDWYRETPWNQSKETFYRMILWLEGWAVKGPKPPYEVEFMRWAYKINHHCENRAFFTTKHGQIGLGPSSMTKGDRICVFKGMPWPAVLRWNGRKSAYIFVGVAYVHGIMQGELFNSKDENSAVSELETFTIC